MAQFFGRVLFQSLRIPTFRGEISAQSFMELLMIGIR